MNNIKTIVLSVILIISINVFAQQQTMNDIPDGANLVNLNDSKYQAMSFGKIILLTPKYGKSTIACLRLNTYRAIYLLIKKAGL